VDDAESTKDGSLTGSIYSRSRGRLVDNDAPRHMLNDPHDRYDAAVASSQLCFAFSQNKLQLPYSLIADLRKLSKAGDVAEGAVPPNMCLEF
jgi:hypothetical protein